MIVYCIIFPNGKRYVGKTECSMDKRMREHKHHSKKSNTRLYNAIRKHGWGNLDWIVLEECQDADQLSEREKLWIKKFNCLNRDKGYNLREGGEGGRHSEKTKSKISESNFGENNGMFNKTPWNKGKKLSKEHRENLSKAHKGQTPWNKGKKGEYKVSPCSEERKKKIGKANSGENNARAKLNWDIVEAIRKEYSEGGVTQKQLAQKYNISQTNINGIVNNKLWRKNVKKTTSSGALR